MLEARLIATLRRSTSDLAHLSIRRHRYSDLAQRSNITLRYPGHGLALEWGPEGPEKWGFDDPGGTFSHGVSFHEGWHPEGLNRVWLQRMTVREGAMLQLMDALTDKPDWDRKVFDDHITSRWRQEAMSIERTLISDMAFSWCVTELRDRAEETRKTGLTKTLEGGFGIVKSDTVVDESLRAAFVKAVEPLQLISEAEKDWHPNSENKVLNLVHPSLYPLVYGRTQVLPEHRDGLLGSIEASQDGELTVADQPVHMSVDRYTGTKRLTFWSNRFQWLPANVGFVGEQGTAVEFESYINNLDPRRHPDLYRLIERMMEISIPAWNQTLVRGRAKNDVRIRTFGADTVPAGLPDWVHGWDWDNENCERNQEKLKRLRDYLKLPDSPGFISSEEDEILPADYETAPLSEWGERKDDDEWTIYNAAEWKFLRMREVVHPEPGDAYTYDQWVKGDSKNAVGGSRYEGHNPYVAPIERDTDSTKLEEEFRSQGLQVIVKLSSVELTPERPEYPGGSWHLEGMLNEHIVGTAIFYYDVENCSPSRISFRQEADLDNMNIAYEQDDFDPINKTFGTERLRDERAVQVIGSVLTRQGRLLVFPNTLQHRVEPFELVDKTKPGHRRYLVLWLVDPMYRILSTANVAPQQEHWYGRGGGKATMTLEEAKNYRLDLMSERTIFVENVEDSFQEYNFCEH